MEILETLETAGGNTIAPAKRPTPSKYWCFTSYNDKMETLIETFNYYKILYCIGRETCPSTKRKHLQGYIESPTKIRPKEKFKNLLSDSIHWERRIGTSEQNIEYCSKENDFESNLKVKKFAGKYIKKQMQMADWMNDVIHIIEGERSDRIIYWIWDAEGGKGKTRLCKYILENYRNVNYFTGGKANDITYQIIEADANPHVCLFDLPRTNEGHISYNALEQLKNGIINSSKYKGGFKMFDPPHVIVFANFTPDTDTMSRDRWNIRQI